MKEPFAEFVKKELGPKTLLITCGLPASYKTETAEVVAKIKGYPILRSDLIRLEVLKNEDVFDVKVAGNMNKRLSVYDEVFRRADELAKKNKDGIILDATFVTQELRRRAAEIAAKNNLTFIILETQLPTRSIACKNCEAHQRKIRIQRFNPRRLPRQQSKFEAVDLADLKKLYPKLKWFT